MGQWDSWVHFLSSSPSHQGHPSLPQMFDVENGEVVVVVVLVVMIRGVGLLPFPFGGKACGRAKVVDGLAEVAIKVQALEKRIEVAGSTKIAEADRIIGDRGMIEAV